MGNVVVGLWSRPVESKYNSIGGTLFHLEDAVKLTREFAASRGCGPWPGKVKSIFMAPEFLFTSRDKSATTAMTRVQRDVTLTNLQKIAQDSPSMLMLPGTIVFKESVSAKHKSLWTGAEGGQTYGAKATANLRNAANPTTRSAVSPRTYTGRSVFPPHTTKESPSHQPEDLRAFYTTRAEELDAMEKHVAIRQSKIDTFLVKNRTYVFFEGTKIFTYGKKCNCNDFAMDSEQGIFVPGKKEGVTTIDSLNVGIEICYDHDRGVLSKYLSAKVLDLHLIMSAAVPGSDVAFMVKPGGYVLHASSNPLFTGIAQKKPVKDVGTKFINYRDISSPNPNEWVVTNSREFEHIAPIQEKELDGGPLRLYEITLPN
jgi:hypothetical protein